MTRACKRSDALAEVLCERLASGRALLSICGDADVPMSEAAVRGWVIDDADFAAKYARARGIGLDCRADAMLADVRACDDPHKARLIFDAERWYLSKLAPKRYGDKVTLAGDADAPLQPVIGVQFISATATAVEAADAYQRLLGSA